MRLGLLQRAAEAGAIDGILPPGGLREKSPQMGVVGALQEAARDMS
jgi:hypothetical protein